MAPNPVADQAEDFKFVERSPPYSAIRQLLDGAKRKDLAPRYLPSGLKRGLNEAGSHERIATRREYPIGLLPATVS
jgi:hypothetical protein